MATVDKPKASMTQRIVWITGVACVACCAIPLLGIAVGSASVAALVGVAVLVVKRLTCKPAPSCDVDGPCAPAKRDLR
jgi:predicted cobalt transporter CbtA